MPAEQDLAPELVLHTHRQAGWTVLAGTGEIYAHTAPELRACLLGLVENGHARVVLDLSAVSFLDCACLAVRIAADRATRAAGGALRIVSSEPMVLTILRITHLDHVLDIHATLHTALHIYR